MIWWETKKMRIQKVPVSIAVLIFSHKYAIFTSDLWKRNRIRVVQGHTIGNEDENIKIQALLSFL